MHTFIFSNGNAVIFTTTAKTKKEAWEKFESNILLPRCESIASAKKEGIKCTKADY